MKKDSRYAQAMERTHVAQEQLDIAIENIYAENFGEQQPARRAKRTPLKWAGAAGAALAAVVLLVSVSFGFGKQSNAFVVKAGAAELNRAEYRGIGELQATSGGLKAGFDSTGETIETIYLCLPKTFEFPLTVESSSIARVTYTVNGGGYFIFNNQEADTVEFLPAPLPADNAEAETSPLDPDADQGGAYYFTTSYSQAYDAQVTPELLLYVEDFGGKYCNAYTRAAYGSYEEGLGYSADDGLDYSQWFYEMFEQSPPSVDIAVTFEDGSTQTQRVDFEVTLTERPYEASEGTYQVVEISAKLGE